MCFAVPPRFAVPSRDAAFAGADKAENKTGSVDTLPLITGGIPAHPYSSGPGRNRACPFRRRLVARIRGRSRLPCTNRQLSFGFVGAAIIPAACRYFFAVIAFLCAELLLLRLRLGKRNAANRLLRSIK